MTELRAEGVRIAPELATQNPRAGRAAGNPSVAVGSEGIPGRFRTDRLIVDTADLDEASEVARELGGMLRLTQRSALFVNGREMVDSLPMPESPTVSIPTAAYDVGELAERLADEGVQDLWVDSPEGAAVVLAAVSARQRGLPISLDRVCEASSTPPNAFLDGQGDDRVTLPGYGNAATQPQVTRSWQYLDLVDHDRVKVAVIDHGYRILAPGVLAPGPGLVGPDLPSIKTMAFNLAYVGAPGAVPGKGFHGHQSAMVFAGLAGNSVGTSGSSGPGVIEELLLMEFDDSMSAFYSCLNYARLAGSHVVNVSMGWTFDSAFNGRWATPGAYFDAFEKANDARAIVVVSAGNGDNKGSPGYLLPNTFVLPATRCAGTITVGAYDGAFVAKGYSNYGSSVDIWAPTDLEVPDVDTAAGPGGAPAYTTFGGTSCASPFIAGIVATLKSVQVDLSASEATDLLRQNGWTNSHDPKVDVAVNAYASMHALLHGEVAANVQSTGTPASPRELTLTEIGTGLSTASVTDVRIQKGDEHHYAVDFGYPLNQLRIWVDYPDRLNGLGATVTVVGDGQTTTWDAIPAGSEPDRYFPPGRATVVVRGLAPNGYALLCRVTQAVVAMDDLEPNDTREDEWVFYNGSPPVLDGSIHAATDRDRFRVAIVRGPADVYAMTLEAIDAPLRVGSAQLAPANQVCFPGQPMDLSAAERFQIRADSPTRYRIEWSLLDASVFELLTEIVALDELPRIWIDLGEDGDEHRLDLPAGVTRLLIRMPNGSAGTLRVQPDHPDSAVRLVLPETGMRGRVALAQGSGGEASADHPSGFALVEVNTPDNCTIRVSHSG